MQYGARSFEFLEIKMEVFTANGHKRKMVEGRQEQISQTMHYSCFLLTIVFQTYRQPNLYATLTTKTQKLVTVIGHIPSSWANHGMILPWSGGTVDLIPSFQQGYILFLI